MTTLMAHDPMTALMIGHIFNTKTDSMTDPLIDPITDQNCEVKAVLHSCDAALHTISPNDCNDPNGIIILMIIIIESGTDQNSCV